MIVGSRGGGDGQRERLVVAERRLQDLIDCAWEAVGSRKGWIAFVERFEAVLPGSAVILALPLPEHDHPGQLVAASLDPGFLKTYQSQYVSADPLLPYLERMPAGLFECSRSLVDDAQLEATPFYREWMEPQALLPGPSFLGLIDRDWEHGPCAILVHRRRGSRADPAAHQELGQRLMPHLQRAVRIHFQLLQLHADQMALTDVLDRFQVGLLIVDGRGRARAGNRSAVRLVSAQDGLSLDRHGLQASSPLETLKLRRLLANPASGAPVAQVTAVRIQRPSGRSPLNALIAPIEHKQEDLGPERPEVAVLLTDPEEPACGCESFLCSLYDLTPAEAVLACELASGHSLQEAARRLRITDATARNRLKQVFAKTGTSRQAALVRLVLMSPGLLRWDA